MNASKSFAWLVSLEGKDHFVVRLRHWERWAVRAGDPVATDLTSAASPKLTLADILTFPTREAAEGALRVLFVRHPWATKWRLVTDD